MGMTKQQEQWESGGWQNNGDEAMTDKMMGMTKQWGQEMAR